MAVRKFDSYRLHYSSVIGTMETNPQIQTSRCYAQIECFDEHQSVGVIVFQDSAYQFMSLYVMIARNRTVIVTNFIS
jgi:hypothetical protein